MNMVVKVNYKIRRDRIIYPIKADERCLDIEPLISLNDAISEYVQVIQRTQVLLSYADGNSLLDIQSALCEEISYGADDLEAVIMVAHKHKLPLHIVFMAYSLAEDYRYSFEKYIVSEVVKLLDKMGLKPMQIVRKLSSVENYYSYRSILEILKAWKDNDYKELKYYDIKV